MAQVLAHLGGSGRAVEPDRVDAERLERGERRADLAAHQHGAGRLDGHLDEDRQTDAAAHDRLLAPVDRRLGLQQVLRGLDEERVGAAVDEALRLLGERLLEVVVRGVPEARQLRARAHRAEHPPQRVRRAASAASTRSRAIAGARRGELRDAVVDAVVAEVRPVRAERVRLDGVDADREVRVVDRADHVGAADVEDLVAALELLVVLERRVVLLQQRAHRAVGDDDPGAQRVEQRLRPAAGGGRPRCRGRSGARRTGRSPRDSSRRVRAGPSRASRDDSGPRQPFLASRHASHDRTRS